MPADDAPTPPPDLDELLALGADHGLDLAPSSLHTEEVGLDFRVAIATATDGQDWVLRIPRRPRRGGRDRHRVLLPCRRPLALAP